MNRLAACAAVILTAACAREEARSPELVLRGDTVELRGIDIASASLQVFTGVERSEQPLLGTIDTIDDSTLRFIPRFPAMHAQPYYVLAQSGDLTLDTTFTVLRDLPAQVTVVEAVYPSADVLPMNLLRMYIQFSAPMRDGDAAAHVRLYDDDGQEVKDAFLVPPQELWDPERQRLTMLFDPGRIKSDLRPHEELGLPLQTGKSYRLVIDSLYRDAYGRPMRASYIKRFEVGAQDRAVPDPASWAITPPVGSAPLIVDFRESLDHALMLRLITVQDASGNHVPGRITIERNETRWIFQPNAGWKAGRYQLTVDPALEDLAGNSVNQLFEEKQGSSLQKSSAPVQRSFVVR